MKRIYFAIAFIVLTIGFAIFESIYISKQTDNIIKKIEEADISISENNFTSAYYTLSNLQNEWESKSWSVEVILLHNYSDSINENLSVLKMYAKLEDSDGYFPSSESTKKQLTSLKESELLSFENIF